MSAFVKASVTALMDLPAVNAVIEDNEIVYRDYIDVSLAVATPKGLVVPVLRNAHKMTFADVEKVNQSRKRTFPTSAATDHRGIGTESERRNDLHRRNERRHVYDLKWWRLWKHAQHTDHQSTSIRHSRYPTKKSKRQTSPFRNACDSTTTDRERFRSDFQTDDVRRFDIRSQTDRWT